MLADMLDIEREPVVIMDDNSMFRDMSQDSIPQDTDLNCLQVQYLNDGHMDEMMQNRLGRDSVQSIDCSLDCMDESMVLDDFVKSPVSNDNVGTERGAVVTADPIAGATDNTPGRIDDDSMFRDMLHKDAIAPDVVPGDAGSQIRALYDGHHQEMARRRLDRDSVQVIDGDVGAIFTPVRDDQGRVDQPFVDPDQQWVVFNIAHVGMPPCVDDGRNPGLRLCGVFQDSETAIAHAKRLSEYDPDCSILLSNTHTWTVAASQFSQLADPTWAPNQHRQLMLVHEAATERRQREFKRRRDDMSGAASDSDSTLTVNTADDSRPCAAQSERLSEKLPEQQDKSQPPDQQDKSQPPDQQDKSQPPDQQDKSQPPDQQGKPLEKPPEPPEELPELSLKGPLADCERRSYTRTFPRDLELRMQSVAVIAFLRDETGDPAHFAFNVLACFEDEARAGRWIRNVACQSIIHLDLDIVSLYEWIYPQGAGDVDSIQRTYRNPEQDRIMNFQQQQVGAVDGFRRFCESQGHDVPTIDI